MNHPQFDRNKKLECKITPFDQPVEYRRKTDRIRRMDHETQERLAQEERDEMWAIFNGVVMYLVIACAVIWCFSWAMENYPQYFWLIIKGTVGVAVAISLSYKVVKWVRGRVRHEVG